MWYHQESNQGHKDFQSFALPTELWYQKAKANILILNKALFKCFCNFIKKSSMNLVIDIGNTSVKVYLFENDQIISKKTLKKNTLHLKKGMNISLDFLNESLFDIEGLTKNSVEAIPILLNSIGSILGSITIGVLSVIFITFFMLKDGEYFEKLFILLFPTKMKKRIEKSLNEIKEVLTGMSLYLGMEIPNWPPDNIAELSKKLEESI